MEIKNLSWLIIVTIIFSWDEVFAANHDSIEQSGNFILIQQQIEKQSFTDIKTSKLEKPVIKNFVKTGNREQIVQDRFKQNFVPQVLENDKTLEAASQVDRSDLDLSLPLKIKQIKKTNFVLNSNRKNYLPDLFRNKQGVNKSILLEAKMLRREEDRIDKEKIVDGAGIDFKLIH